ncbi:MAG: hypothetical protein DRI65_19170, partial [Chloroflexota bacterium]
MVHFLLSTQLTLHPQCVVSTGLILMKTETRRDAVRFQHITSGKDMVILYYIRQQESVLLPGTKMKDVLFAMMIFHLNIHRVLGRLLLLYLILSLTNTYGQDYILVHHHKETTGLGYIIS